MRGSAAKDFRRQAAKVASKTVETMAPAINAAIGNEKLTRDRVEAVEGLLRRGLRGRLLWLLTGR